MRAKILFHIVFLPGIFLMSCTERIDIELETSNLRLVVYGEITTDFQYHTVQLTETAPYFSNEPPPPVSGALVEVDVDTATIRYIEIPGESGNYRSEQPFHGVPGTEYQLTIENLDVDQDGVNETYRASSVMPPAGFVDSLGLERFQSPFFSGYQVRLYGPDPPMRQWYNCKLIRNENPLNETLSSFFVQSDDFFNGSYIYGLPIGFLDDDDPFESITPGDTVMLELNSITETYYTFIQEAQNELSGNNPLFSGPPANVTSNIDRDALGIFTTYAITRKYKVVE